jgi:predicted nucleic acid-binding protein
VIACASFSGANILYSEDMQDGLIINKKFTIINPFK